MAPAGKHLQHYLVWMPRAVSHWQERVVETGNCLSRSSGTSQPGIHTSKQPRNPVSIKMEGKDQHPRSYPHLHTHTLTHSCLHTNTYRYAHMCTYAHICTHIIHSTNAYIVLYLFTHVRNTHTLYATHTNESKSYR